MIGYKTGSDMSAELKRTAHAVRQTIDARKITVVDGEKVDPRRSHRGVQLRPRDRHALYTGKSVFGRYGRP